LKRDVKKAIYSHYRFQLKNKTGFFKLSSVTTKIYQGQLRFLQNLLLCSASFVSITCFLFHGTTKLFIFSSLQSFRKPITSEFAYVSNSFNKPASTSIKKSMHFAAGCMIQEDFLSRIYCLNMPKNA